MQSVSLIVVIHWIVIYLMDSTIQHFNYWGIKIRFIVIWFSCQDIQMHVGVICVQI